MKYVLWQTITHPKINEPMISSVIIHAGSIDGAIKNLKIPGERIYQLKRDLKTSWKDKRGATFLLELKHEEND